MEKGTILTLVGFACIVGGIYWFAINGSMGILLVILLGFICIFFAGDQV